jgi:hypothetical protein
MSCGGVSGTFSLSKRLTTQTSRRTTPLKPLSRAGAAQWQIPLRRPPRGAYSGEGDQHDQQHFKALIKLMYL